MQGERDKTGTGDAQDERPERREARGGRQEEWCSKKGAGETKEISMQMRSRIEKVSRPPTALQDAGGPRCASALVRVVRCALRSRWCC